MLKDLEIKQVVLTKFPFCTALATENHYFLDHELAALSIPFGQHFALPGSGTCI